MIRFQAPQLPPVDAVARYFAAADDIRWYSNRGPCHRLLVERLEEYLTPARCVPVANATLGLMLGLRALVGTGRGVRREVLIPSYTFAATINAVLWAGLRPVFVDVEERGWHLDPLALADAISQRSDTVAAVLACSTFGVPPAASQRAAWERVTQAAGIPLLVDSAAGFGSVADDGRVLGHQGDAEVFSFHATKPFAIGEGGLLSTADDELADRLERLSNFGFEDGVVDADIGLNAKLPEWSAATALAVLDDFPRVLASRRASAAQIVAGVEPYGYRIQDCARDASWQFVPVLTPSPSTRAAALEAADDAGIELRTYFSVPLHRMPAFAGAPIAGSLRCTEELASRALSLPMSNDLSDAAVDAIIATLARAAGAGEAAARRRSGH